MEKRKIIKEKIREEELREMQQLNGIKRILWDILVEEKGFQSEDIKIDPVCTISMKTCESHVTLDYIINLSTINFMAIRCSASSMESWERYILAFARAACEYQIPYAAVTDGNDAHIFDVLSGALIGQSVADLFHKEEALKLLKVFQKIPYPPEKVEREKRILYAFEGIKCPPKK